MSGVIRTPSMSDLPPPDVPCESEFESRLTGVGGGVPPKPRLATRPLLPCCWPWLAKPPDCDVVPAADSRSMLELDDAPEPGASSFDDASSPLPELPVNMSFNTRAIWRASPYLTR